MCEYDHFMQVFCLQCDSHYLLLFLWKQLPVDWNGNWLEEYVLVSSLCGNASCVYCLYSCLATFDLAGYY
jgi:hypothetical protein